MGAQPRPAMLFTRPDIPLDQDSSARFLPWLIAFMVFLASLALASLLVVESLVERWDEGLRAELTVQVPPPEGFAEPEALAELRAERLKTVLAIIMERVAVRDAQVLSQDAIGDLVEPWLGSNQEELRLFLPSLIAVRIDESADLDIAGLRQALNGAVEGTQVDDHQRWLGALVRLARSVELGAILVLALVAIAGIATIVFVTRASLSIHRHVIELLHLMGAEDRYIAKQFQVHALRFGLRGGLIGFAAAAGLLAFFGYAGSQDPSGLLPRVELGLLDWAILAIVLVVTGVIAMVTARLTVIRTLGKLR
ncbi:MAG: FtsX-like permease family protein [Rhodospirillales bacterium]